jgi:hypothetical protein
MGPGTYASADVTSVCVWVPTHPVAVLPDEPPANVSRALAAGVLPVIESVLRTCAPVQVRPYELMTRRNCGAHRYALQRRWAAQ